MGGFIQKTRTLLREYVGDRRRTLRRQARYMSYLLLSVSLLDEETDTVGGIARPSSLAGHTRDLGESDLTLALPAIRIGSHYLTLEENRLLIQLDLPSGLVQMVAAPVRFAQLAGDEEGYLLGVRIVEMSEQDRARYTEYLHTLPRTERRASSARSLTTPKEAL